jgi:hypothetical protein
LETVQNGVGKDILPLWRFIEECIFVQYLKRKLFQGPSMALIAAIQFDCSIANSRTFEMKASTSNPDFWTQASKPASTWSTIFLKVGYKIHETASLPHF